MEIQLKEVVKGKEEAEEEKEDINSMMPMGNKFAASF